MKYMFDPKKLTDVREQLGWSKRRMAKELDVNRQSIIQWESGDVEPRAKTIAKIATTTKTEPGYFFAQNNVCVHRNEQ